MCLYQTVLSIPIIVLYQHPTALGSLIRGHSDTLLLSAPPLWSIQSAQVELPLLPLLLSVRWPRSVCLDNYTHTQCTFQMAPYSLWTLVKSSAL